MTDLRAIEFPPLLTGIAVAGDPLTAALESVETEVEPGSVFYAVDEDVCHTALVLAPEVPLSDAMSVSFAVTLGMNDALGALAPPEVAVHLVWPDRIKVNGALCGELRATASSNVPTEEPDWLILELRLPVTSVNSAPGTTPDATTLHDEGCGDITAPVLIETWARHTMNWLHIWLTEGFEPLHREWLAKADGRGEDGFVGLDEWGGLILKDDTGTRILPLTQLLDAK